MITKLCIWFLRLRNIPIMLNIQLVDDVVVTIPKGRTLYHTRQLKDSGRLLAIQEEAAEYEV